MFKKLTAPTLKELFVQELESMILSGELKIGQKLPPERELQHDGNRSMNETDEDARTGSQPNDGDADTGSAVMGQDGRPLGARAIRTRTKLLECTQILLTECQARDVSVVEIARRAGTSPATFYQYFADIEEAALELATAAAEEVPAILESLAADWNGAEGLDVKLAAAGA